MEFKIGKKYTGENSNGETFLIQITKKYSKINPEINRYFFKVLKGNPGIAWSDFFESDSAFAKSLKPYEDLPRICYVLGGEDTPLKVGEKFDFESEDYLLKNLCINWKHELCLDGTFLEDGYAIQNILNHPEKIIRSPQFSDDEEALMRLLVKNGLPYVARDKNKALFAYPAKPVMGIDNGQFYCPDDLAQMPNKLFPYITFGNSPFDAKAYLESEAKNDG